MEQQKDQLINGAGVGLRACHYEHILQHKPQVAWFEVLSDNYMVDGGPALRYLDAIAKHYPLVLHGVGLSIGSVDPLDETYLHKLAQLKNRVNPGWISDHLCWISTGGQYFHDLLPLPFTEEIVQHVAARIRQVQDSLGTQILIENVSSYFEYQYNEMQEWEFINAIAQAADCFILLDVNNVYVSANNHQFPASDYIQGITADRVKQLHMAGYADKGDYLFDSHSELVHPPVWDLYRETITRLGAVPTLMEWDDNIPCFKTLQAEAEKAQQVMDEIGG